jgi:hypothetical protein
MKGNEEYGIEQLSSNRLNDLATLFKSVYGHWQPKDYFKKKYSPAYTGTENIGFIAYKSTGNPVAFFGVIPCFIQYEGRIVIAAQASDAMTHPDHRYKGIFVALVRKTLELCMQKKIQFVFGFPNQNSYHVLVEKLHWQVIGYLERFSVLVNTVPLESLFGSSRWTRWIYKKYADLLLRKYVLAEEFQGSDIAGGFAGVYRDKQYFHYKKYNSSQALKLGTANAWIKIKNGLLVGDLNSGKDDFDITMRTIIGVARRLGVTSIDFQVSPGTQLHSLLASKYSSVPSFPVIICDLGADIPLNKLRFAFADIDIF